MSLAVQRRHALRRLPLEPHSADAPPFAATAPTAAALGAPSYCCGGVVVVAVLEGLRGPPRRRPSGRVELSRSSEVGRQCAPAPATAVVTVVLIMVVMMEVVVVVVVVVVVASSFFRVEVVCAIQQAPLKHGSEIEGRLG